MGSDGEMRDREMRDCILDRARGAYTRDVLSGSASGLQRVIRLRTRQLTS